jgi:peptidoglycan/LPS O-acetylase OafA/YrhL
MGSDQAEISIIFLLTYSMHKNIVDDLDLREYFVPPDSKTRSKASYNYALEGLRGLAAIWVVYAHVFGFKYELDPGYHPTFPFQHYFHAAHGGVLIFFVLSGYVIGLTNQAPFSRANAIRYLLRRFIRLYPIYLFCIILAVLASPHDTWKTVLGNLFFLQGSVSALLSGNGVLWTLHYEVIYYFAFLAIWYFRPKILPLVWSTFIVACLGWFIPSFPQLISGYAAGLLFWLFGLWLAWNRQEVRDPPKVPLFTYLLLFIATDRLGTVKFILDSLGLARSSSSEINLTDITYFPICAILFTAVANYPFPGWRVLKLWAIGVPLAHSSYLLAIGNLFEPITWSIAVHTVLAVALIRWRIESKTIAVFAFIGSISYGIYVLHMPIMHLVSNYFPWSGSPWSFTLRLVVWGALTIGLSYWLELTIQPILKRWFQKSVLDRI